MSVHGRLVHCRSVCTVRVRRFKVVGRCRPVGHEIVRSGVIYRALCLVTCSRITTE
jgi:hypothetical protein